MSRIVVSTSSSGLDNLDIEHDIELIRLRIYINNIEFIDGRNIDINHLTHMMLEVTRSPVRTSPAPSSEVDSLFARLVQQGYKDVFVTTLSSKLSESFNIIQRVAENYKNQLNIYVYDTKEINACEGILALEADHLLKQGETMPNIAKRLDALRACHKLHFAVDDLSFLIKNKKLSATSGFFANLFSIKPVLHMSEEGRLEPLHKIRKIDRAITQVIEDMAARVSRRDSFSYYLSTGRDDLNSMLMDKLQARVGINRINEFSTSAIALANLGPTGVGICSFTGDRPYVAEHFEQQLR